MKNKRWKILVLLSLLFSQAPIGLAEEQSIKSEGVTGFYGTYEYPEDETSSSEEGVGEPTSPSSTQDDQTASGKNGTTVEQEAIQGDSKQLPKTGEYRSKQFTIIGSFLLLIVLIIIVIKRRRREK
ncbi:hypothetical protein B835_732 [Enterococcus mundtii 3F]|uniref:LPXTG cell wall anchor domain-containing protein n=1 Tax=Enterococcus mundtii TaxID=53346 RepID=UPI00230275EF|nr:LPXTG cell wall anchor domain-containing protein [Enterococcus mundtii]MDA9460848.1 hypothetical protein [Enterococcus mundtii 3F]